MAKKHRETEALVVELENEVHELQDRNQHLETKLDEKDEALQIALRKVLMLETALAREIETREKLQKSLI